MLQINNLSATVADKPILKGLSLSVGAGEMHAIMGPNGAGKSTLAYVLGGRPGYEVTGGSVSFNGQDLLALDPHERAAAGLFLGFQYPVEIPGVSFVQFLRESLNAQRRARGEAALSGATAIAMAVVWGWAALSLFVTYVFVSTWGEWWQYVLGAGVVALLCLFFASTLSRDASAGREDATMPATSPSASLPAWSSP